MKNQFAIGIIVFLFGLFQTLNAQLAVSHDFNDGTLGPFEVCTTGSPNYSRVIGNRLETHWREDAYNGSRTYRGAEACGDQFYTYKEGWYGMNLEIGSDYSKNKKGGIAQIFGFVPGFWSWEAQLQIDHGDLTIVHRASKGTSGNTEEVVYADFPYEVSVPIVIHFILSNENEGVFEIWVNGNVEYRKTNINFGFGDFDRNDVKIGNADADRGGESGGSLTVFKMGQYNFQSDDYDNNETRTVYYDDVSWYSGSNGYDMVNPMEGEVVIPPPSVDGDLVHITKSNATGYAIDGGNGGSNGQNVTLSVSNTADEGQLWVEIDRGDGFYSYEKYGTNYSLDGNGGGATRQSVYVWQTDATNQNQQWQKVAVGDGGYKLIKRNATGFAINGGSGGVEGRDINLWDSASANQNLQWYITPINAAEDVRLEAEDFDNMSGIQTEASSESGENVGYVNNGDWLRFDDVNLSGITNMDARVATRTAGGTIEVRTGSVTGTLIGSIDVSNTGGYQNWTTLNTSISNASGTEDVYLVFTGGNGYLFNVNWIEFNTSSRSNKDIITVTETTDVIIYPNPVVSTTTIQNAMDSTLNVYDINGSIVFTKLISSDTEVIDLSKLAIGIYYTEINGDDSISVVKLVKN